MQMVFVPYGRNESALHVSFFCSGRYQSATHIAFFYAGNMPYASRLRMFFDRGLENPAGIGIRFIRGMENPAGLRCIFSRGMGNRVGIGPRFVRRMDFWVGIKFIRPLAWPSVGRIQYAPTTGYVQSFEIPMRSPDRVRARVQKMDLYTPPSVASGGAYSIRPYSLTANRFNDRHEKVLNTEIAACTVLPGRLRFPHTCMMVRITLRRASPIRGSFFSSS